MARRVSQIVSELSEEANQRLLELLAREETAELSPTHPSVVELADAVARYARARQGRSPGRSAASWLRERLKALEEAHPTRGPIADVLYDSVGAAMKRVHSSIAPTQRGVDEGEAADLLGIRVADLRAMLRTANGRRALWYPLHIGDGRFRWLREWFEDPEVQSKRIAGEEPPHPVSLPATD